MITYGELKRNGEEIYLKVSLLPSKDDYETILLGTVDPRLGLQPGTI
jgi:hypothetical protein